MRGRVRFSFGISILVSLAAPRGALAQGSLPLLESPEESRARLQEAAATPPAPAPSEPPYARFGSPGQFVITNSWVANVSSTSYDGSKASYFAAEAATGVDYFVARNLSIGFDVDLTHTDGRGYGADGSLVDMLTTSFSGGARVGYNVPLSRAFSLYPRASFGVEWAERKETVVSGTSASIAGSPTGGTSVSQVGPYVNLYVPLVFHVAPHFFVGFGPSIFRDFGRAQGGPDVGAERTRVGAGLDVGGYLGGSPAPEPPPSAEPRGPTRRFGDAGEVVISGYVATSAFWTGFDGTGSSDTSFTFSPGFDYFVLDHVSIGVGASVAYSNVKGLDGAMTVTSTTTSFGLAPRIGVDVPLGRWLSAYAQGSVSFGYATQKEDDATSANDSTQGVVGVGLYAPLLLHVAPHLFVGLGPSLSHELTHSYAYPNGSEQIRATSFGAGLIVGGWL